MTSADAATLKKLLAENRRLRQQLKAFSSQPVSEKSHAIVFLLISLTNLILFFY